MATFLPLRCVSDQHTIQDGYFPWLWKICLASSIHQILLLPSGCSNWHVTVPRCFLVVSRVHGSSLCITSLNNWIWVRHIYGNFSSVLKWFFTCFLIVQITTRCKHCGKLSSLTVLATLLANGEWAWVMCTTYVFVVSWSPLTDCYFYISCKWRMTCKAAYALLFFFVYHQLMIVLLHHQMENGV